jgi:molybdenum cofactor cytidylyltransferase
MPDTDSSHSSPLSLAVLLLAAGRGSRLGFHPKALLKKGGVTLLTRLCGAIQPFHPVEFIAITGFHGDAIEQSLLQIDTPFSRSIQLIRNLAPERGQASSVRLGIERLQSNFDAVLIMLSDQPLITNADICQLLNAFIKRKHGTEIVLPMVKGQRGNPVLFSRGAIQKTLAVANFTCRDLMDLHPELVHIMDTENDAFVCDVDTPEDMKKYDLFF